MLEGRSTTWSPNLSANAAASTIASGALAADLAADSADLLDVSAALGLEFRHVVAELLRAPDRPAPSIVRALASIDPRPAPPQAGAPPFVWVRLISARTRPKLSVRAGWLVPAAVRTDARVEIDETTIARRPDDGRPRIPLTRTDRTTGGVHTRWRTIT